MRCEYRWYHGESRPIKGRFFYFKKGEIMQQKIKEIKEDVKQKLQSIKKSQECQRVFFKYSILCSRGVSF